MLQRRMSPGLTASPDKVDSFTITACLYYNYPASDAGASSGYYRKYFFEVF
ncbi:MAG: hypothetical protein TR69_WS6001000086 [candidate division WS6 bacterium OLB20]|uniref:Uncharacterized protein n=1 Tax=candidate division WS6 bacterium OLB20 TaxID=1617426 RepID=A0A136LZY2_9BACT|nr:MAG: hypothetical protein TR69_WS6001000086 [candidate division WS6 bacterium OLB20]